MLENNEETTFVDLRFLLSHQLGVLGRLTHSDVEIVTCLVLPVLFALVSNQLA